MNFYDPVASLGKCQENKEMVTGREAAQQLGGLDALAEHLGWGPASTLYPMAQDLESHRHFFVALMAALRDAVLGPCVPVASSMN